MSLFNSIVSWVMKKRIHQIGLFMKYPVEVQMEWFKKLVQQAQDTEFGKLYGFADIRNYETFSNRVPVHDYESLKPFIDRMVAGEQNILWPSEIRWFAKSSGTTSSKSKFIPLSTEAMEDCHFKGGKDMLSIYCNNYPETKIFAGKGLTLGGSHSLSGHSDNTSVGDLSAIIMENLPVWVELMRTPDLNVALMGEWEAKLDRIVHQTIEEDVTNLSGVPSWMLILLQRVMEIRQTENLLDVWPNLELFMHGGVSFAPYREQYKRIIPSDQMHYLETYNASEGFFGIQDQTDADDMLLMLDYGIFYEFIPAEREKENNPPVVPLSAVETGKNYAMLITTNSGLWRYKIGDVVSFSSINPYRIRITGRTKSYINTFGEELIVDNAEKALTIACEKTGAIIREYTAGPVYMDVHSNGAHEWLIEFEKEPEQLEYFTEVLDNALKSLNSDYEAKRYKNMTLRLPIVRKMETGTFYKWLKSRGKLGGQHKVPRLSNDRSCIEEILAQVAAVSLRS
jgi:hypothetical protein